MKVKATLTIGLVGCKREKVIEIDDEDLEGLDESGRNDYISEVCVDWAHSRVEVDWEEVAQ